MLKEKLSKVGVAITRTASMAVAKAKVKSPEILLVAGLGCISASYILVGKASYNFDETVGKPIGKMNEMRESWKKIKSGEEERFTASGELYSQKMYARDMAIAYAKTAEEFMKAYWIPITLGAFGFGCIIYSHKIMVKRQTELILAYEALEKSFKAYKKKVHEKFGEEAYEELEKEVKEEEEKSLSIKGIEIGSYTAFFDSASKHWDKDPSWTKSFLTRAQWEMNQELDKHGFLFLNTVLRYLDLPETSQGAVTGWVRGEGEDYVDFGLFRYNEHTEAGRRFINGLEPCILLDFNCDGVMFDKLNGKGLDRRSK